MSSSQKAFPLIRSSAFRSQPKLSYSRPCEFFLDELDALAKLRDDHQELGELKRVVVSLLQNIDSMSERTVLLAATNHEHLLDPAIWRRFAFRLHIDLPDLDARRRVFEKFLGGSPLERSMVLYAKASMGGFSDQI
jgi:SpoVK/Ycf46/Vps4 family AAA+-type ATPase